jgi:predicted dienelactone hydrolase
MTYDPFVRGQFPVGVRTIQALDDARARTFPCEIWYPAARQHAGQDVPPEMAIRDAAAEPGTWPLILFSHHSGGHRRAATFLCTHLSSHGYIVAALDHSEVIAPELRPREGETAEQRSARADAWIAHRVPDIRFLLDRLIREANVDRAQIGIVGHSFGGWTALAAPEVEPRIRAVVALAPGGNHRPRPGILPLKLTFAWGRDVPTLYLAAENDVPIPLAGIRELLERTPATKQLVILRRADHYHFMDNVEEIHEAVRAMKFPAELDWMTKEMRPIAELCSGEQAHLFVRGLTLCHMDRILRHQEEAQRFLTGNLEAAFGARGVDVISC